MRLLAILGGYVVVMATLAPVAFARVTSLSRVPRLGIALWQACVGAVIGSVVLLLAVKTPDGISHRFASALTLCLHSGHRVYAVTGRGFVGALAVIAALLLTARLAVAAYRVSRASFRRRARQRDLLALVGSPSSQDRVFLLDDATPIAYCVPGRRSCVVMTTAALAVLDDQQLAAVLEHERTHLSERHHLVVGAFDILVSAFPFVKGFRLAREHVSRLVEMIADDAAVRRYGRDAVSGALLRLASTGPPGLLNAGGPSAISRVERLLRPRRVSPLRRIAIAGLAVSVLALPLLIVLLPSINPAAHGFCPL